MAMSPAAMLLLFFLIKNPCSALKCACNTDRGPTPCPHGECRADMKFYEGPDEEYDKLGPVCVIIRNPLFDYDFYSCSFASLSTPSSQCTAGQLDPPADNVTVEKCWCNSGDYCNEDMLMPRNEPNKTEQYESTQPTTTTKNASSTETRFHGVFTDSTAIPTNADEKSTPTIVHSTGHGHSDTDSFRNAVDRAGVKTSTSLEGIGVTGGTEKTEAITRPHISSWTGQLNDDRARPNSGRSFYGYHSGASPLCVLFSVMFRLL